MFNSPIKSDLYFINTTQFIGNRWGTKNPILMRDKDFGIVRITSFGTYSFRVIEPARFIREVFGARKMNMTYDILQFLNSFVSEAITTVLAEAKATLGLGIEEAVIENIGLPPEVEKLVDEQSGLGLASQDMSAYMQYQTVRAMRDASKQKGGLAGLGAGIAFGNHIAGTISSETPSGEDSIAKLWEYKKLLDEGVLSQDEFDALKKKALKI
ncbi:MAG: SPFH domain-containing protein [Lawsonibacter sp.]|nr:SPFH domain-containing protein [Lawsonibacter sp.]